MTETVLKAGEGYKTLIVYQKALENVLSLLRYYRTKKILWTERFIIAQLLRALASIGANIAEGYGRNSSGEYRRFLSIAKGSSLEAEYWIDLATEARPQDKEILENVRGINKEVIKILTVLIRRQPARQPMR